MKVIDQYKKIINEKISTVDQLLSEFPGINKKNAINVFKDNNINVEKLYKEFVDAIVKNKRPEFSSKLTTIVAGDPKSSGWKKIVKQYQ